MTAIAAHRAAAQEYLAACSAYDGMLEHEHIETSAARSPQGGYGIIVSDDAAANTLCDLTPAELRIQFAHEAMIAAEQTLARTAPTTAEGAAALVRYAGVYVNGQRVAPSMADWQARGVILNDGDVRVPIAQEPNTL